MENVKLIAIAAVSKDGVIGVDAQIPWRISEDFKHFRETTMGCILIVGFNTYMTLPEKAFEGRTYFVLNGGNFFQTNRKNVYQFEHLEFLLAFVEYHPDLFTNQKIFVAGGEMIYASTIDYWDEAIITWVDKIIPEGNKRFPIDKLFANFVESNNADWQVSKSGTSYKITQYKRK